MCVKFFLKILKENYTLASAFYGNGWIDDLLPLLSHSHRSAVL